MELYKLIQKIFSAYWKNASDGGVGRMENVKALGSSQQAFCSAKYERGYPLQTVEPPSFVQEKLGVEHIWGRKRKKQQVAGILPLPNRDFSHSRQVKRAQSAKGEYIL